MYFLAFAFAFALAFVSTRLYATLNRNEKKLTVLESTATTTFAVE